MAEINGHIYSNVYDMSMPVGEEFTPRKATVRRPDILDGNLDRMVGDTKLAPDAEGLNPEITKTQRSGTTPVDSQYGTVMTGLAGAKFVLDVVNAQSAYSAVAGQAALNIMQARNQGADAIYRGRQAAFSAQSEGYTAGNQAALSMAAQGQDVQGAGVSKIQSSYEAMGAYQGMQEEINSMREALGYELEEVAYGYQTETAKIQRDYTMIGSAMNFGASAAHYGAM